MIVYSLRRIQAITFTDTHKSDDEVDLTKESVIYIWKPWGPALKQTSHGGAT